VPLLLIIIRKFISDDERWVLYDPKRKIKSSNFNLGQTSTSAAKLNIYAKKVLMCKGKGN